MTAKILPFQKRDEKINKDPEGKRGEPGKLALPEEVSVFSEKDKEEFRGKHGASFFYLDIVFPMRTHLHSLVGKKSRGNIDERRKGLKDLTDEELKNIAARSKTLEWNKHPSYFWALVEEIESRNII